MRPLRTLAAQLEASDAYTSGHSRRVARYATLIGTQLPLTPGELRRLHTAAVLHDVGKIAIPEQILHKPGALTEREYEAIKAHPARGAQMIDELVGDPRLSEIVRHHHERFDGSGYPAGLSGPEIPLGARVIAVADTFDAIASRRPYRRAGSFAQALAALLAAAGTQLDPELVARFGSVYSSLPGPGGLDLLAGAGEQLVRGGPWHLDPARPTAAARQAA